MKVFNLENAEEVAYELGDLIGCTIKYNVKNNQMQSINSPKEEDKENKEGS